MSTDTIATESAEPAVAAVETKQSQALKIRRRYVLWSMGGGMIPLVGVDIVAIIGVQIKMIAELSKLYGIEFKENRVKSIVTTLIGGLGLVPIGTGICFSLLKLIPVVGALAATVSIPISAGAITYATGKMFIAHFESGGTLLSFNAEKMKAAYKKMFEEGKNMISKEKAATPAAEAAPVPEAAK